MRKVPCCDKQRQCNIWTSAVSMQGVKLISSSYFFREISRMSLLIAAESWFRLQITLDLSEFNGNVMTRNNGAHQCSPYYQGIQKWLFLYVQTWQDRVYLVSTFQPINGTSKTCNTVCLNLFIANFKESELGLKGLQEKGSFQSDKLDWTT